MTHFSLTFFNSQKFWKKIVFGEEKSQGTFRKDDNFQPNYSLSAKQNKAQKSEMCFDMIDFQKRFSSFSVVKQYVNQGFFSWQGRINLNPIATEKPINN